VLRNYAFQVLLAHQSEQLHSVGLNVIRVQDAWLIAGNAGLEFNL
jgi:hypothetical protein